MRILGAGCGSLCLRGTFANSGRGALGALLVFERQVDDSVVDRMETGECAGELLRVQAGEALEGMERLERMVRMGAS